MNGGGKMTVEVQNEDFLDEAALNEDLLDELHAEAVSNQLIRSWVSHEKKVWQEKRVDRSQLSADCREAVLQFMEGLARLTGLSVTAWHVAALLFDQACMAGLSAPCSESAAEDLPAAAAAIVLMLRKDECSTTAPRAVDLVAITSQFATFLQSSPASSSVSARPAGSSCREDAEEPEKVSVTASHILDQERQVLTALKWDVFQPSVPTWTDALCKRLDVISHREFKTSLSWVRQQSFMSAQALLMQRPSSSEMPPRRTANGLLCLFLVVARVVPLSIFRPPQVTPAEWEALFLESKLATTGLPSCDLSKEKLPVFLRSLLSATGCSPEVLQSDALAVARAMRLVVASQLASAEQEQHTRKTEQDEEQERQQQEQNRRRKQTQI